jgi:hypothetical protein
MQQDLFKLCEAEQHRLTIEQMNQQQAMMDELRVMDGRLYNVMIRYTVMNERRCYIEPIEPDRNRSHNYY